MFVLPLVFAAAAASSTLTDAFMQRLAQTSVPQTAKAQVTVGALPPDWKAPVPLPTLKILGSVRTPSFATQIYYTPANAGSALQQYLATLQAAGFHPRIGVPGGFSVGGFTQSVQILCRGSETVSVSTLASDDLRVDVPDRADAGMCMQPPQRITTPLPNLVAPTQSGVSVINAGGVSFSPGAGGSSSSSAKITSSLPLTTLMGSFAQQFAQAGWKARKPFVAPQGAAQSFTYDKDKLHWRASLLLIPDTTPHTYTAYLGAAGSPDFSQPAVISPARPAVAVHSSDETAILQLVKRIVADQQVNASGTDVYVRQLPPGLGAGTPLPQGTLVGSVAQANLRTLYYDLTRVQFASYLSALEKAGYAPMSLVPHSGGFALDTIASTTTFCKAGAPMLNATVQQNTADVTIRTGGDVIDTCASARLRPENLFSISPLPRLVTPQNATMHPGSAGVLGGESGASIVTAQPLKDVLASFAGQLTAAKWSAGTPLLSDDIGSQSFGYEENGAKWQAVLTIYRSQKDAKTYYAFIDVTQL